MTYSHWGRKHGRKSIKKTGGRKDRHKIKENDCERLIVKHFYTKIPCVCI